MVLEHSFGFNGTHNFIFFLKNSFVFFDNLKNLHVKKFFI
jgi:hypothetical protein